MVDRFHCYYLFQHQSLQCQRLYTTLLLRNSLCFYLGGISLPPHWLLFFSSFFQLCLPPILLSPLPSLPVTSHRALRTTHTFSMLGFLSSRPTEPGGRTLESSLKLTRYFFCTHMSGAHCSRPLVLSSLRFHLSNSSNSCLSVPTMSSKHLHLRNQLNITLKYWLIIAY